MRSVRVRGNLTGTLRPMAILTAAVFLVWLVSSSGFSAEVFLRYLDDTVGRGAAGLALSLELSSAHGELSGPAALLRLGSPILSAVEPPAEEGLAGAESTEPPKLTETNGADISPSPYKSSPPILVPMLPWTEETEPPLETSPPTAVLVPDGDDRVWAVPDANAPGAQQVKEVTLIPSGQTNPSVIVNNETQFSLDIPALLEQASVLKPSADGQPQVLIIHTHGSESYLPDERAYYVPTDIERTEDTRYNVVRLGDEMAERLTALGIHVIHDRDIHDYPTYNGSYNRAYACIVEYKKQYPGLQIVIDLHRDSITAADGTMYKTVSGTEQGKAAQMMFVIGSNGSGLSHDNWRGNLSFAAKLQEKMLDAHPTIMRPIHLRKERFNMHATPGSVILEVGTAANALDEALLSIALFCDTVGPYLAQELTDNG